MYNTRLQRTTLTVPMWIACLLLSKIWKKTYTPCQKHWAALAALITSYWTPFDICFVQVKVKSEINENCKRYVFVKFIPLCCITRGADKSLARPGRKQATATKLHILQATQTQFRRLSVQPGLRGSNDLHVRRKMAIFQLFFQSDRAKDLSAPLYILSVQPVKSKCH
jgi:hypothetical protein